MNTEYKTIKLTTNDIKTDHTNTNRLIDKVAVAINQWTEDDMYEANFESKDYILKEYILKEYNCEQATLDYLNKATTLVKLTAALKAIDRENIDQNILSIQFTLQPLLFGAFLAIKHPLAFLDCLQGFTEQVKELANEHEDNLLKALAPTLPKELEEAEQSSWDDMHKQWLYGDRDTRGLIKEIAKYFNAEQVQYKEKEDTLYISWLPDEAREMLNLETGEKMTLKMLKENTINCINNDQEVNHNKELAERAKRKDSRLELQRSEER